MLNHYVIIRFRYKPDDPTLFTRHRFLHEVCLHSLYEQTNQNFKIVLLTDEEGLPCDLQTTSKRGLNKILSKEGFIITTRVDSDDVVLPDFIDNIQKTFNYQHRLLVDHCGYTYDARVDRFTERTPHEYCPSQFISIIEQARMAVHCMANAHSKMGMRFPMIVLPEKTTIFCVHSKSQDSCVYRPGFFNNGPEVDRTSFEYYINKLQELEVELDETLCNN